MKNPYETLGVNPDDDDKTIKDAYRKKAKSNHPDAGGDEETFKEISHAYTLLSNPEKRAYYDQHGEEQQSTDSPEAKAAQVLSQIVDDILTHYEPENIIHKDILGKMKKAVRENLDKLYKERTRQQKSLDKMTKMKSVFEKRLTHEPKKFQTNLFLHNINGHIKTSEWNLNELKNQETILNMVIDMIDEFTFEFDAEPATVGIHQSPSDIQQMMEQLRAQKASARDWRINPFF